MAEDHRDSGALPHAGPAGLLRRLRAWTIRASSYAGGGRHDADVVEELETHVAMHAADLERSGVAPAEARRRALIALGGIDQTREAWRDRRGLPLVETTVQDLRYAVRGFRRAPAFTAAALIVLALGIGANAAIFTIVNTVLLKPLPFREPDRLVMIWHVPPPASFPGMTRFAVSAANFLDWQRDARTFERMAIMKFRTYTLTGHGEPAQLRAEGVGPGFFEVLGVQPLAGRVLRPDEEQRGRHRVAVLSYRLWQTRFGSDSTIVGRTIQLDGEPYAVVGIMPRDFAFPDWAQLWTPLAWTDEERAVRGEHSSMVVARLAPGQDFRQAQAEVSAISHRLEQEYPEDDKGWGAVVVSLHEDIVGDIKTSLLVLLGAVALVLLIACANVANLVLARTLARRREMAIRLALGAGPGRVIRQVLTETALLALSGGALGLFVAHAGIALIVGFFGDRLPQAVPLEADGRVLVFTAVVSLLTGLAAGAAPAIRLSRERVSEAVKQGGGRGGSDAGGVGVRRVLVVVEVALSLVLLIGAGLMIRSLWMLNGVDAGLDSRNVLTGGLALSPTRYPTPDAQRRFFDDLLTRVRALPGVESAGVTTNLPLDGGGNNWPIAIGGRPPLPMSEQPQLQGNVVTPEYFRTLRIPLVRGRAFTPADTDRSPAVALVSEAAATWLWPGEDPIGQRITIGFFPEAVREIVGIVADVKERGLAEKGTASLYLPFAQLPQRFGVIVLRTETTLPAALGPPLEAAVRAIDPSQPVVDLFPMEAVVAKSTSDRRFTMLLLAAFAGLALVLAAVGIYSVLAYTVRRRVREIGIRMALGASRPGVVRMVLVDALGPTLVGVGLGLAGAIATRHVMSTLVFGVSAGDPVTFASVAALIVAVALVSSALPAWAAARVDPVVALRDG